MTKTALTNVNNELTDKALNLYLSINSRPGMEMFLERIYGDLCEALEIEPEVDLDNPFTDSPYYQRSIIGETLKIILTLDSVRTSELNTKLQDILAHIEDVEGHLEGGDDEDEDALEVDEDEDEDEDDSDEDEDDSDDEE